MFCSKTEEDKQTGAFYASVTKSIIVFWVFFRGSDGSVKPAPPAGHQVQVQLERRRRRHQNILDAQFFLFKKLNGSPATHAWRLNTKAASASQLLPGI